VKVLLVAHGYPPELLGGTEKAVQGLAHGLVRRGDAVVVVAGSMRHLEGFRTSADEDPVPGAAPVRVRRIHRADLFFDHWQKSASARVVEAFRAILREERPELVHVHHWIRLSRDLVHAAAQEGIPAAVTLHDLWTSCLIAFRVRPDSKEFCEAPLAASPCLDCAALVPPRTPWVPRDAQHLLLAERRADLVRELALARAVIVPSRAHADSIARFLGVELAGLALEIVPHGRELALTRREPPPLPDGERPLVLGAWGHLHPLKGQDLVIEAVRRLREPRRVVLHLAGGEVDAGFLARLRAAAEGLDVRFHGPFAEADLATHPVAGVHAMVSGTRARESWGLVVDEALALGVPMVLPRAGAFPERFAGRGGAWFYEPRDAASLAGVLQGLLGDPASIERTRAALPDARQAVPGVDAHVERLRAVYARAAAQGPPPVDPESWWAPRMRQAAEAEWDAGLARRTAAELGFEEGA